MILGNPDLVSVAMATYNGSKYIEAQLDSIISQSYKNIEIVIVDDCSTDDTVLIIERYINKYKFIRLYKNNINLGVVKTFSSSISSCSGKYIALADQDDVWLVNKLEKLMVNIGDNLLIYSDAVLVDKDMRIIANSNIKFGNRQNHQNTFIDYLIRNNVTGCTALISQELVNMALPIPDQFYIHDHYLALVASYYGKIKLINEPLIYYRQHDSNSIGAYKNSFDKFSKNCKVIAESYDELLKTKLFINNYYVELLRDYRLAIYLGKWKSKYSIFNLLKIKNGLRLLIYYLALKLLKRNWIKNIYNKIYKIKH